MSDQMVIRATLISILMLGISNAFAETPTDFMKMYGEQCKHDNPAFQGFDPGRGQALYTKQQASDWNCATCHTDDPRNMGAHCETHKEIRPMSPASNPDRFTDAAKVEKWFKRSCKDVLGRECTAQEKGDFLAYMLSLK
jgi:Domain of unknown function (DUF1924)